MAEYRQSENAKRERKFFKCYCLLKTTVKGCREAIKSDISEENIRKLQETLESAESEVLQVFNEIRNHMVPSQEVREKIDRTSAMTRDSLNALEEVIGSLEGSFDQTERQEIMQQLLRHGYAQSVYSSTAESQASKRSIASERLRLEAELAAKRVQIKQDSEIEVQRSRIKQMEQARDLNVLEVQLKVYREVESSGDEENQDCECNIEDCAITPSCEYVVVQRSHQGSHQIPQRGTLTQKPTTLNPNADPFHMAPQAPAIHGGSTLPPGIPTATTYPFDTHVPTHALADTFQRSRLPVLVPQAFSGNPLEYVEFERSFKTLIENCGILPGEKSYCLKQYVTGSAKEAIEGFSSVTQRKPMTELGRH